MSARDTILGRLRSATAKGRATPAPAMVPANAVLDERAALVRMFTERTQQSGATVRRADNNEQIASAVRADAGIAETGTLCFHSHAVTSQSLFLCEELVVVLNEADILPYQEDYWRQQNGTPPRSTHLVTGPSRTADVEQTIQIGAHGPKRVSVLLTTSDE